MGTIDDYLAGLDDVERPVITDLYDAARRAVPDAEQGKGYGMPALVYHGKPLISIMATKKHLSLFPFSADVVAEFADELDGFDVSKGTIRFQPDAPLSAEITGRIATARARQIDG